MRWIRLFPGPVVAFPGGLRLILIGSMPKQPAKRRAPSRGPTAVAVIDIGTTSVRMAIAEISNNGNVRLLETLVQPIELGRDTFRTRNIARESIEATVDVLRNFKRVLEQYGITGRDKIRVVATSAVREASNRLSFVDRVYIATGLSVETIDEAEVNRITYLGIHHHLDNDPVLSQSKAIVIEVGGGSTEILVIRKGNVLLSESIRLGSVRLAERIESVGATPLQKRTVLESQINRFVTRLADSVTRDGTIQMISIGGDMRFAARELDPDWDGTQLTKLGIEPLQELANEVFGQDSDHLVKRFGVTFLEASTLSAALFSYVALAKAFDLQEVYVSGANLRDGLLRDMASGGRWNAAFRNQIIRSAVTMGRKYHFEENYARAVAELAHRLFWDLEDLHQLDGRFETILYVAAILHEIGLFIGTRGNHKHAMYLIRHSELFGLSRQDLMLVALVARYHRRAYPQPGHDGYSTLNRDHRVIVAKLAAMLRLAIALNDSRSGRIREVSCEVEKNGMVITVPGVENLSLEQLAIRQNSGLFKEVFGADVMLRSGQPQPYSQPSDI